MVLYFAGFERHFSIYPATARLVGALEKDLAGRLHSKATIRFPFDEAVPTRLITRIAKLRAAEAKEPRRPRRAKGAVQESEPGSAQEARGVALEAGRRVPGTVAPRKQVPASGAGAATAACGRLLS